ncbi:MAG: oxygen-independent coproporphyrinogen III oxidase [Pseudomonadales bacterium]
MLNQAIPSWDSELIKRHDLAGPRYTSYPTALQFDSERSGEQLLDEALASTDTSQPLSLYFHIPFCAHVCYYCACNKVITARRDKAQPYLDTLYREMAFMAEKYSGERTVNQLHWGGGTPTFISDAQMVELMAKTRELFNLRSDDSGDYSIEIDPRECAPSTLNTLREIGFNRISLGVQDVQEKVQQAVNRIQSTEQTVAIIEQARELGFKSINIDLIYGLPHQSAASFIDTLKQVVAMSPDRLSVFNYAHMPDRFRPQRHIAEQDLPTPQEKLAIHQMTIEFLINAGYVYIGMDHFAKPDDELAQAQSNGQLHRNFQGYTTHADCDLVAMGVSSISQIGDLYYQNSHDLPTYTQMVETQDTAVIRGVNLNRDDKIRRAVITELICHFSLDMQQFSNTHDIDFSQYFAEELPYLQLLADDKLLTLTDRHIQVTSAGRLLIRRICMVFDAYAKEKTANSFSRII